MGTEDLSDEPVATCFHVILHLDLQSVEELIWCDKTLFHGNNPKTFLKAFHLLCFLRHGIIPLDWYPHWYRKLQAFLRNKALKVNREKGLSFPAVWQRQQ
jgi:hypothetical protein